MPAEYNKSKNFLLRMLTGKSPVHEIGTGFQSLGEDVDAALSKKVIRLEGEGGSFLSWGVVKGSNAEILAGTGDFTVEKTSTGNYSIKWTTPKLVEKYAATVSSNGAPLIVVATEKGRIILTCLNGKEEDTTPSEFRFIAVAPS